MEAFVDAGVAFHAGLADVVEGRHIRFLDRQVDNDRVGPAAGRTGEVGGHRGGAEEEAVHASCPLRSWIHR